VAGAASSSPGLGRRDAGLVFLLALIPRLAHWLFVRATPLAGEYVPDLSAYLDATSRLMDSAYLFRAPMFMSPGYALFLAPQYILRGPDAPLFVLVNAVLDAGSAALCGLLAARLAPAGRERAAGLWAGGLYACCGQLLFYALLPLGEGPAIFCLLAGLVLFLGRAGAGGEADGRGNGPENGLAAWLTGALFGLAALLRPNLFPAVVLGVAVWAALGRPRAPRLRVAGRVLAGLLLALSPLMAHNLALEGRATPFGFQGGVTLFAGNHPGASGGSDAVSGVGATPGLANLEALREAERRSGRELTLSEADAFWYASARRFFASQPGEAARVLGRKALLLVNNSGLDATMDPGFSARFSPVPGLLALPPGLVLALAAAGLWRAVRRKTPEGLALAAALFVTAGLLVLYQVTPRYRVVLLPLCLCFAGALLAELPDLLRGARRALVGPAACALLILGLSCLPLGLVVPGLNDGAGGRLAQGRLAQEHARLARYYLLKGPAALAVPEYEAALALGAAEEAGLDGLRAGLEAARAIAASAPRP